LVTDHKRKAVTTRIPYLDVLDRENDATELHDTLPKQGAPTQTTHDPRSLCVERDGGSGRPRGVADYRVAVAQTAPLAKNVTPAMKIAVSNLVISQPLRMARLNCLTAAMEY